MTWQVSPEEWLLDFTVIPRGFARGGESLDPIDDRLRSLLVPPPRTGIVIPTITAARAPQPAAATVITAPTRPTTAPNPTQVQAATPTPAGGLSVELRPIGPPSANAQAPLEPGVGMVIPSLTRIGALVDDDDDDLALERISPIGGSEIGIPHDDADDVMSAVAASAPLLPLAPESELERTPPEPPPDVADEIEDEALEMQEEVVEAREPPTADNPIAPRSPAAAPVAPPAADKAGPPRPPTVAAPPDKAGPPRPPPTSAGPPRPPPVAADKAAAPPRPPPDKSPARASGTAPRADGRKKRGWYDEAFSDHYASILPVDADASAEIDAAFVQKCLELANGLTLLDVGCGDGRHANAFARMGLDVTGLDNSMPQLLRAARRNEASKFNFDILHGDMRAIPRDRAYDAVTCLGTTFGYFETDEQNRQCLQDMVEVLKPGGKLALQLFNRDYLMSVLPCRSWWQGRGCLVLDVADMQSFAGRVRIHRTIVFEDGRQFEHHVSIRAYSAHTLAKMLASLGARVLEISGSRDTRGRFYGGASPEIWIFAQRRDDV